MMPTSLTILCTALLAADPAGPFGPTGTSLPPGHELVFWDAPDERGNLTGGIFVLPLPDLEALPPAPLVGAVETVVLTGPSENRVDLVCVGDGYLATEFGAYAAAVEAVRDEFFSYEPFLSYAGYFNLHRVDVVSNESGVDNDPVPGIERDTAMDMEFWCQGIERALCIDIPKAMSFASLAPDVDQVIAMANSTLYGGLGYSQSDLVTMASDNEQATDIAIHELGHSLGDLADEYALGGATYDGPEFTRRNITIFNEEELEASGRKWAVWLGEDIEGFDSPVGAFEGAGAVWSFGAYRPSPNSKMRSLSAATFNLPSVEAFVIEIYKVVDPIDGGTPNDSDLGPYDTISIDVLDPATGPLRIEWRVDGVLRETGSTSLALGPLVLAPGSHTVEVTVVDDTWFVRDALARANWLTQRRTWTVNVGDGPDLDADGDVDFDDLVAMLSAFGPCAGCTADLDGDGIVAMSDLVVLLAAWSP